MAAAKELMDRLENHPPGERENVKKEGNSPRGPTEEPVAEEADIVDDVAEEGEDEEPLPADQVGRVHHDEGGEGGRDDLDQNLIFLVNNFNFIVHLFCCKHFKDFDKCHVLLFC